MKRVLVLGLMCAVTMGVSAGPARAAWEPENCTNGSYQAMFLRNEFKNDPFRAKEQYCRLLHVLGQVSSVSTVAQQIPTLRLAGGLTCYLLPGQDEQLSRLTRGSWVVVEGTCAAVIEEGVCRDLMLVDSMIAGMNTMDLAEPAPDPKLVFTNSNSSLARDKAAAGGQLKRTRVGLEESGKGLGSGRKTGL